MGDCREGWREDCESYVVRIVSDELSGHSNILDRPGPPKTTSGASPTYFVPWKVCFFVLLALCLPLTAYAVQDHVPLKHKLNQILSWIDMPIETRPQFIMGMRDINLLDNLNPPN